MKFKVVTANCLVLLLLLSSLEFGFVTPVTVEQMKQMAEPLKLVCIPKSKISEEALTKLSERVMVDEKELKCYINCLFEMMQVVSSF